MTRNVIRENFHTKHSVLTAPDEHMPYIIQLHSLWAYGEHIMSKWSSRTSDQFTWLVSEKKTETVNAYLTEWTVLGGRGGRKTVGRTGRSCIGTKNRSQMTSYCNGNHSKTSISLSLCLKETENWNSSSKTLFYKDCSLGSVKTRLTTSPCKAADE